MKIGSKVLAIVLLLLGVVLINYLAAAWPARLDLTAESIYSLSSGTKAMLGKMDEAVNLELYFSKDAASLPIAYKNYAARVQELLRQYVRASRGKLTLTVINPRPDTPEEERAAAANLTAQEMQAGGETFYFGLVATQADQQKTIPAFTPQREQFLEYDLSKLVYSTQRFNKPRLGLITSLPLQGAPANPMMPMARQGQPGQAVADEWAESFELVPVEATASELPANLDVIAVIHPEGLSPRLQFGLDQFLLGGKPVFLAVDPSSEYFKRQAGQQAMFGGPTPNVSSDLPALLGSWGLAYDASKVVGDLEYAAQVQTRAGPTRYPIWLRLTQAAFNSQALPTAQLGSAVFIEPGSIALKPGSKLNFSPLIETSTQAGELNSGTLQFAQPEEIARQLTVSGKHTLAALVTGRFATAFPNGQPAEEKPADNPDGKSPAPTPTPAPKSPAPSLRESKTSSTLIVVADTDWLFDNYSIRKFNFLGQAAAEPINDNLAFAANSLEFLAGSQDLISIRGKGNSLRTFKVVEKMEIEASRRYQQQLGALESKLQEVQAKLTELQGKRSDNNRLVATPEMQRAIEDFQKQSAKLRGERRSIRLALRENINALENKLLALNLLVSPLLVLAFAVWFFRARRHADAAVVSPSA